MDLPILNQLEKIYPNQDTGAVAIRKLVKNQNLIEQGIKEIDDINDLDEVRDEIGILVGAVNENTEKINVLKEHGFWSNAKLATGSVYDLQHGEWFGALTDSPESYTCFYKVYVGDNANYKYIECYNWITNKSYKNACIGGVWQPWEKTGTTEIIPITALTFLNGFQRYIDSSFGYISRSGNIVHVNVLLAGSVGTVGQPICMLPFTPMANEIHHCNGINAKNIEIRTLTNGALSYNHSAILSDTWINIDIVYTCV